MAIDILVRESTLKAMPASVANARNLKHTHKSSDENNNAIINNSLSSDDVVFTKEAQEFAKAQEIAMQYDGIDYEKVARIKKQLEDGTFEFNYERIAGKMIAYENDIAHAFD